MKKASTPSIGEDALFCRGSTVFVPDVFQDACGSVDILAYGISVFESSRFVESRSLVLRVFVSNRQKPWNGKLAKHPRAFGYFYVY